MKKGDTVELISTTITDIEDMNWIELEESEPKIGDRLTIKGIGATFLTFNELLFAHPMEKFKLVK